MLLQATNAQTEILRINQQILYFFTGEIEIVKIWMH